MKEINKSLYEVIRNLMCILLIILLITTLVVIQFETGSQAQQIIISEDTTWTLADSPYIITGNVLVEQGKNLTIEPGVEVKFNGFYSLQIEGKLVAEGTETNMITFTSNRTSPAPDDWNTIKLMENADNGTVFKYCRIEFARVGLFINEVNFSTAPNITYCEIKDNFYQGLMYYAGSDTISTNILKKEITNNSFINNGDYSIDIEFFTHNDSSLLVSNNVIKNNDDTGINFRSSQGYLTISHNSIIRNEGNGILCKQGGNVNIKYNLIMYNNGSGIVLDHEHLIIIEHNSIINNSNLINHQGGGILFIPFQENTNMILRFNNIHNNYPNDAENDGEFDRNISNNWWGKTDTESIEQNIYDYYDDFTKGKLKYTPFLIEPDPEAPDQSDYYKEPPIIPAIPIGTSSGIINSSYFYSTFTTEPFGEQIRYGWDWNGNGSVDEWSEFVDSGSEDNRSHSWPKTGIYNVKVKAVDEFGAESPWSDTLSVTISIPPNDQPSTPSKPSGPNSGKTNTSYTFSSSSTDPDGNQIKYGYDWDGDGIVDEWSGLRESGAKVRLSYNWSLKGTYNVKVKAVDEYGGESEWSDVLKVKIGEETIDQDTNGADDSIIPIFLIIIIIIVVIALIILYLRKRA